MQFPYTNVMCMSVCDAPTCMTVSSFTGLLEDRNCLRFIFTSLAHSRCLNLNNVLGRKICSLKSDPIIASCVQMRLTLHNIIHSWAILQMHLMHFYHHGKINYTIRGPTVIKSSSFSNVVEIQQNSLPNERMAMSPSDNPEIVDSQENKPELAKERGQKNKNLKKKKKN